MRVVFILFVFLMFPNAYGGKRLLGCLGREEWALHRRKDVGPQYYLNRLFVSRVSQRPGPPIKSKYLKEICEDKVFSPSMALLRALLLWEGRIFSGEGKASSGKELAIFARRAFFDYMLRIQSLTETPDCLTKYIPEYAYFLERYKYLEADYSEQVSTKQQIRNIFDKLKNLDTILDRCSKDKKHRQTHSLKKS